MPHAMIIAPYYYSINLNVPFQIIYFRSHLECLVKPVGGLSLLSNIANIGKKSNIKTRTIMYMNVELKFLISDLVLNPFSSKY
jgi:hypothetical protein